MQSPHQKGRGKKSSLLPTLAPSGALKSINFDEANNSIYIDVICSHIGIKYAGEILIKTIQDICEKLFMTKIYLKSVKSAISFYEKIGFTKKDSSCDDMCLMIKTINKKTGGKTNKRKKRTKKTEKIGVLNVQRCKNVVESKT